MASRNFPPGNEAVPVLSLDESNDGPGRLATSLADALNSMIPVFKDELVIAVSHDDWRRLPAILGELVHGINAIIPVFVVNRAQHWVVCRPGQAMQLIQGQLNRPSPPSEFLGQVVGENCIVAAGTREESTHPLT